jgi:hypothetical protein
MSSNSAAVFVCLSTLVSPAGPEVGASLPLFASAHWQLCVQGPVASRRYAIGAAYATAFNPTLCHHFKDRPLSRRFKASRRKFAPRCQLLQCAALKMSWKVAGAGWHCFFVRTSDGGVKLFR